MSAINKLPSRDVMLGLVFGAVTPLISREDPSAPKSVEEAVVEFKKLTEEEPSIGEAFDAACRAVWLHGHDAGES